MNDIFTVIICSLMLAAVMPVTALVLFAIMKRHVVLSEDTPMHAAVLSAFDNKGEVRAYQAGRQRSAAARTARVMALYDRILQKELQDAGPDVRAAFLRALSPETMPADTGEPPKHAEADDGIVVSADDTTPRHDAHVSLWRRH